MFFELVGSTLLHLWGERFSPRFVVGCIGNIDLGVHVGKDWVGMVPLPLLMLDVMKGSYLWDYLWLWRLIWLVTLMHYWFQALVSCAFMPVDQVWVPPLMGGWFLDERAVLCPLIMSKMLIQRWWAWFFFFAPSCMASMEVKLSPMEVEI